MENVVQQQAVTMANVGHIVVVAFRKVHGAIQQKFNQIVANMWRAHEIHNAIHAGAVLHLV